MYIDTIGEWSDFNALRDNWDAVYEADPEANFFLSWQWMSNWLDTYRSVWFILGAKEAQSDEDYVAFLPLRMKTLFHKDHGFSNEIYFAGYGFSDYGGILARPEFAADAITAFAKHVKQKLYWARFTMENLMMSDQRRRLFLKAFDKPRFVHTPFKYIYVNDPTDQGICPFINLPPSWDEYLQSLSANNRQKIRRLFRKLDGSDEYRITVSDAESTERDLATLLEFWKIKWTPHKGAETVDIAWTFNRLLSLCSAQGRLFLPVFWHRQRPVAALATLIDDCKRSFLFAVTGRDETFDEIPAGYLLHAYSIRHAIERGFTTYDFLRGNEPYKYLFTRRDRRVRGVTVHTKTNRNLGGKLDPRALPTMIEETLKFEKQGETGQAERGYRQILEIAPDDALTLFRFGRLMAQNGAHDEARDLLARSVAVEPDGDNAWFWLAQSLEALGEPEEALEAYRRTVKLQPLNEKAKARTLELASTVAPSTRPAKAATRAPKPRRAPVSATTTGRDVALQELVAASIDPNWVRKQIADERPTPRRKP